LWLCRQRKGPSMECSFASYQIAEMASAMEREGNRFYQQLADFSTDEAVKELFLYLAKAEKKHEQDFLSIAQDTKASEEIYEYHVNIAEMMKSGINKLKKVIINPASADQQIDIPQALEIAINAEKLAVEVYTEILEAYSERFSKTLKKIIAQENSHLKRIKNLRQTLLPDPGRLF